MSPDHTTLRIGKTNTKIGRYFIPYLQRLNRSGSRVAMHDPIADALRRRIGQTLERKALQFENGLRRRRDDRPLIVRFEKNPDERDRVESDFGRYHRVPEAVVPELVFRAPVANDNYTSP